MKKKWIKVWFSIAGAALAIVLVLTLIPAQITIIGQGILSISLSRASASSTLTLRPNAAGNETSITSQNPSSTYHWDKVCEVTADDMTTYVYTVSSSYQQDLYSIPDHTTESGTINSITIYFRCHGGEDGAGYAKPSLKSDGTVTDGTEVRPPAGTWQTYSQQWTTNPANSNQSWTWTEIDALQIGVAIKRAGPGDYTYCTQVYVVVDYTAPTTPTVTTQACTDVAATSATGNGNITDTGGANATTRGFCYMVGQSGDPTTANSTVYDNGGSYGTGTYTKSITGLTASTYYRVRAYAINSAGTGYGSTVQLTTLPGNPSALTDTAHNGVSINLSWTKGTGAENTTIRYRTDQYPTSITDGTLGYNGTGTTTSIGSLTYGQIYYFRAWAYNTTTTLYSAGTSDKSAYTDPNAPTAFTVTSRTSVSIALNWALGTGADKTRIQYRTDQYPTAYDNGTQAYFDTGTSINVTSLSAGQIYYFRAWSYSTSSGYYDSYAQLTDYTLPGNPSALDASNPTSSTIDVSWTKGTGGDKTMVRYKKASYPTSVSDGTQLYFDTGTSQQATGLDASTTYYFRAWAYDSDSTYYSSGTSDDSETTLAACSPNISNTPDSWSVNDGTPVDTSSTYTTGLNYFQITNNSGGTVDISIQGTDLTSTATLYEYYDTGTNDGAWIDDTTIFAQTFTPSISHKITDVELQLWRGGSPGTLEVNITTTDENGYPTSDILCSGTINGNTLPDTLENAEWRDISLGNGYDLSAGTQYAIVLSAPDATGENHGGWILNYETPGYEGGMVFDSEDGGETWNPDVEPPIDLMFREWGSSCWILSDNATPGDMIYGMEAGLSGENYTIIVKKNSPYNNLVTGLADSATQYWGLEIYTPTSYDDGSAKSGNITITATCA